MPCGNHAGEILGEVLAFVVESRQTESQTSALDESAGSKHPPWPLAPNRALVVEALDHELLDHDRFVNAFEPHGAFDKFGKFLSAPGNLDRIARKGKRHAVEVLLTADDLRPAVKTHNGNNVTALAAKRIDFTIEGIQAKVLTDQEKNHELFVAGLPSVGLLEDLSCQTPEQAVRFNAEFACQTSNQSLGLRLGAGNVATFHDECFLVWWFQKRNPPSGDTPPA